MNLTRIIMVITLQCMQTLNHYVIKMPFKPQNKVTVQNNKILSNNLNCGKWYAVKDPSARYDYIQRSLTLGWVCDLHRASRRSAEDWSTASCSFILSQSFHYCTFILGDFQEIKILRCSVKKNCMILRECKLYFKVKL